MADENADPAAPDTNAKAPDAAAKGEPEKMAALEAEIVALKDRLLRTMAEMENLRRRSEREMADTRQYAVANFARDMLTVSDNLRRAIDSLPGKPEKDADPALSALIEGVEMTERGLGQTLEKFGVRPIAAKGEKFDPANHQAMFEVENADLPAGSVAEVVQTGYLIGERVLRPALVGVAKGGPKKAAKANAEETADEKTDSDQPAAGSTT